MTTSTSWSRSRLVERARRGASGVDAKKTYLRPAVTEVEMAR